MTPLESKALPWWKDWGSQFGWTLYDFDFRLRASFFIEDGSKNLFDITAEQRAGIDRHIDSLAIHIPKRAPTP